MQKNRSGIAVGLSVLAIALVVTLPHLAVAQGLADRIKGDQARSLGNP